MIYSDQEARRAGSGALDEERFKVIGVAFERILTHCIVEQILPFRAVFQDGFHGLGQVLNLIAGCVEGK